jgi:hypothetical protein
MPYALADIPAPHARRCSTWQVADPDLLEYLLACYNCLLAAEFKNNSAKRLVNIFGRYLLSVGNGLRHLHLAESPLHSL